MLEDDFNDVLGKAIRGLGLSASKLGVDSAKLSSLLAGEMDENVVREMAPLLDLDTEKIILLENYIPTTSAPRCLHTFVSPFGHLGVNAFIVETTDHLLIFDTGTDSRELLQFISAHPNKKAQLFITHAHPDHTAGVDDFETVVFPQEAQDSRYDDFQMTCLDVAGHCSPATAYLIESTLLEHPICIVGDAIFAGSIGGCKSLSSYPIALSNIKENLLTLPPETLLCSGHGPLTTVAQELENNPFF